MSILRAPRYGTRLQGMSTRGRAVALTVFAAAAAASTLSFQGVARYVIGIFGLLVLALVTTSDRDTAFTLILVWLVMLGFLRRILIPFAGWSTQDPFLLVSPAAAVMLWLQGARNNPPPRTMLSSIAIFLSFTALAQAVNPSTAFLVGIQGTLFYLTPLLWFFVGRTLDGNQHDRMLRVIFLMSFPVMALGFYQTFVGLLPFEYTWLDVSGQGAAIFLEGFKIRPFSTLVSPQEYGYFMSFTCVIVWGTMINRRRGIRWLPLFAITVIALFYQGSRGILLFFLLAMAVMAIFRTRSFAVALLAVSLFAGGIMFAVRNPASSVIQQQPSASTTEDDQSLASALTEHQIEGITDPSQSTAPIHVDIIVEAFGVAFRNPLGLGVGATSIAGYKGGEKAAISSENDIAQVFAALGLFAGLGLAVFIMLGIATAIRLYARDRSARHLIWLGMLIAALTQWWSGQLYATSSMLFIALGGIAREHGDDLRAVRQRAETRRRMRSTPARARVTTEASRVLA